MPLLRKFPLRGRLIHVARESSRRALQTVAVCASAGSVLLPAATSAQGLGYTLAPAGTSIQWTDRLGLDNSSLFGGQLSLAFDRLVALQGYYFTNNGLATAVDRLNLTGSLANQLANQTLDVRSYGANVLLTPWNAGFVLPFLKAGGGVIDLRPEATNRSRQIALNLGGGLRIGGNSAISLDLFAEDMIFRVDRYALFAPVAGSGAAPSIPRDPEFNTLRHNFVVGAALGIPIGPSRDSRRSDPLERFQWGLAGTSFALEPMIGRLSFDDASAIPDQDLAGVRAGFDVSRLVGVRGFYWRGTNNQYNRLTPLQSWGAEAQFKLNSGPGITPFLLAGGAQLDFRSGFNASGHLPTDKTSLILGGGIALPLSERVSVNLTGRDYVFGQGSGVDSVSSPSDLTHNWMFSAGLRLSIGGRSGAVASERVLQRARMAENRADSLARVNAEMRSGGSAAVVGAVDDSTKDTGDRSESRQVTRTGLARSTDVGDTSTVSRDGSRDGTRDYTTNRTISIPAPASGEIYVRYGPVDSAARVAPPARAPYARHEAGGDVHESLLRRSVSADSADDTDLRRAVRDAVRAEMREQRPGAVGGDRTDGGNLRTTPDSLGAEKVSLSEAALVDRIVERVNAGMATRFGVLQDSMLMAVRDEVRRAAALESPRAAEPTTVVVPAVDALIQQPARPRAVQPGAGRLMTYSGFTLNDGAQLVIGGRFDVGPVSWQSPSIRLLPEIALGFGSGGRSTMIAGNAEYSFPGLRLGSLPTLTPHVIGGLGLLNFSEPVGGRDGFGAVLNLGYGASAPIWRSANGAARPVLFVEHQGVGLFNLNRLLVGLTWR